MKKLLFVLPLVFGGCSSSDCIKAGNIEGVTRPILDRHDAYVQQDETLEEFSKKAFLRSSELLRKVLDEATGKVKEPE